MSDLLFGNNNKDTLKKLAKADLKVRKLKTFLSGTIILVATCLLAVVFTVLVNDALSQANATPYHAMYRAVDAQTKDALLDDRDFGAVGLYKNFGGTADESGITTIAYMNQTTMKFLGFRLFSGGYPVELDEAAVSAAYMERHGLTAGSTFTLSYTDALTNRPEQKQFTICGVIQNDMQEAANQFYVLTSDKFRAALAQQAVHIVTSSFSTQTPASVDVLVKLNAEKDGLTVEEQKTFLQNKGLALEIKNYDILLNNNYIEGFWLDAGIIVGIAFFAAFLMFASSFAIYSIFYISVVNSMPMYAQLMSLGTTEKQLRYFLKRQGNLLALGFIPPGMVLSLAIARLISGTEWIAYDAAITLASGVLIFMAIKAALRKPAKTLAAISPIEAMKYTDSPVGKKRRALRRITPSALAKNNLRINRGKNLMAVVSLSVSGALMIALAILVTSLNLPARLLEDYPLNEDFQIGVQIDHFYERFPQVIQNNPLSKELVQEIASIPGVEKVMKDESVIGRLLEPEVAQDAQNNMEVIESASPELLANISRVISGSAGYDDIGTDGVIMNQFRVDYSDLAYDKIKVGDTLRFQFEHGGERSEKTLRVIGIAYFPSTGLFYSSPEVVNGISPFNNTSHLSVFCDEHSVKTVQAKLRDMISRNPNLTLHAYAEDYKMFEDVMGAAMSSLYGVSAFVMMFGLLNMVNMLISSAAMRKREFTLLQAVGMTNRQLRVMLYREGTSISVSTAAIAIVLGVICGRLLCYLAYEGMALKFIIYQFTVLPPLLFAVLVIGVQMTVSFCVCKSMERETLTERLRTE